MRGATTPSSHRCDRPAYRTCACQCVHRDATTTAEPGAMWAHGTVCVGEYQLPRTPVAHRLRLALAAHGALPCRRLGIVRSGRSETRHRSGGAFTTHPIRPFYVQHQTSRCPQHTITAAPILTGATSARPYLRDVLALARRTSRAPSAPRRRSPTAPMESHVMLQMGASTPPPRPRRPHRGAF